LAAADAVRELLAVALIEERFIVVEIELRRAARLEEIDDAFGLRGEVREPGEGGSGRWREGERGRGGGRSGGVGVATEEVGERNAAEAESEAVQALAAAH
jgi:hypothetical protein